MTRTRKNGWFGQLKLPWERETIAPPVNEFFPTILSTVPLSYATREYQAATLAQTGAGAAMEWRTPLVEPGFVEVYEAVDVFLPGGAAATSFRGNWNVHGIDGQDLTINFARRGLSAGQRINLLSLSGDSAPESGYPRQLVIPAGAHLLVDTTGVVAVGTDPVVGFLRYRIPGPPGFASVEDVTAQLTP